MEMEDQYSISDLRHFISTSSTGTTQFPPYPPPELFSAQHPNPPLAGHYDMLVMGPGGGAGGLVDHQFNSEVSTTTTATAVTNSGGFDGGGDGGSARWPRQETLTLLEVRSRLDHKFKEANQKGPLWDEVARIMLEEHGYQRSGKKCREKFENLYKYYKKTKEGKAGRQDGKHYRFFRQLEALYGEHSSSTLHHHHHLTSDTRISENTPQFYHNSISPQPNNNPSASLSTSSGFDTSSSEDDDVSNGSKKKRKEKRGNSWKAKIKEFIDLQMRKIMEKQEQWLEKVMKGLEKREQERVEREEEWRKREAARVEREHEFWASERAWIEARDSALMRALEKITNGDSQWPEVEITRLIQLRTNMESRFEQCGFSEEVLWEDIAAKMVYFGYERSAIVCKEKWDSINKKLQEKGNNNRKKNEKINNNNNYGQGGLYMNNQVNGTNNSNNYEINDPIRLQLNDGSSSSPSSHNSNINVNSTNVMNDSCLRFFLGDHGDNNLGWETNYGVKSQQG